MSFLLSHSGTEAARVPRCRVVALLSDFGPDSWYAGAMRGIIYGICPEATVVDITHSIARHSIAEGAFVLSACRESFPVGTAFVAVVDPGVGTSREPVIVSAYNQLFVGPNNGLLGLVGRHPNAVTRVISNAHYFAHTPSATFHGRDVFAPTGAHLVRGVAPELIAPDRTKLVSTPFPAAHTGSRRCEGQIIAFDHFGNAITNISHMDYDASFDLDLSVSDVDPPSDQFAGESPQIVVRVGSLQVAGISRTYGSVGEGDALAYWGSAGFLELGLNQANARENFGLRLGDEVTLQRAPR